MKNTGWIWASEKLPSVSENGREVLIYQMPQQGQLRSPISICKTATLQYLNPKKIWWMELPKSPFITQAITEDTYLRDVASCRLINTIYFHVSPRSSFSERTNLKIKDLAGVSVSEYMKSRNVGIKTVTELKELCLKAGIILKP